MGATLVTERRSCAWGSFRELPSSLFEISLRNSRGELEGGTQRSDWCQLGGLAE